MTHLGWPAFIGDIVIAIEFVGGIMLVLGILARPVAVIVAVEMLVALIAVALPARGFGGSELEFMLLFGSLTTAFAGAGAWSLVKVFEHKVFSDSSPVLSGEGKQNETLSAQNS